MNDIIVIVSVFFNIGANVRVYEPLRDSERFLVELPQGNQMSEHSQTRYQQWLIHDVELNPYGIAPFKNNTNLSSRKPL